MGSMGNEFSRWLETRLNEILGFQSSEIVNYIVGLDNDSDRHGYLVEMLDPQNCPDHQTFLDQFQAKSRERNSLLQNMTVYKKPKDEGMFKPMPPKATGARPKAASSSSSSRGASKEGTPVTESTKAKGKAKFVNLYSESSNDVVMLKGRHKCDCLATKHDLINNCLRCGRIVCAQEGPGPCLFCANGAMVVTKDQQEVLDRGSKQSERLRKKLLYDAAQEEEEESKRKAKAEAQKNRLLEFDRTSEKRTKVIDDESDYFSVDAYKWMTEDQKKKFKAKEQEINSKKHGSRLDRKLTFDFAGRRIVENFEAKDTVFDEHEFLQSLKDGDLTGEDTLNPYLNVPRPKLVEDPAWMEGVAAAKGPATKSSSRLQDKELQEMSDQGACMSMHQPWATYLVAGIKIHEGRTWYSPHRGRLWIHAAAKEPTEQEVKSLQDFYRVHLKKEIAFPPQLPVSCLLGCVDVIDVLAQEEYREKFPDGESTSPYVFICENPQELMIKFPMQGKHKIYELDSKLHGAAMKSPKKSSQYEV